MYSALSTFNTTTEVPLSKAPNPQLLPGRRSINGCPLLRVCVHCCVCALWMGKCRAQIPSMGHHTWLYVTSLSLLNSGYLLFFETTIMGKTADLAMIQKTNIDALHKEGKSQRSLLKGVAVYRVLYQSILNAKLTGRKNLGRKRCSSNRDDRKLENTVKQS